MSGTEHAVAKGDDIHTIAATYGWVEWEPIWDHAQNAELREKRPNPFALEEGDSVFVPDKQPKRFSCETGKKYTFKTRTTPRVRFHLQMFDDLGTPYADCRYELKVGAETFSGNTEPDGSIEHRILVEETSGDLDLYVDGADAAPRTWKLKLGHLSPVSEEKGLRGRLVNLGLLDPDADDEGLLAAINDLLVQADKDPVEAIEPVPPEVVSIVATLYGDDAD